MIPDIILSTHYYTHLHSMQVLPLLAECGLSGAVDEELQRSGAVGVDLCVPVGTQQLSKVFPTLPAIAVFLMWDQSRSLVADTGLAAAA